MTDTWPSMAMSSTAASRPARPSAPCKEAPRRWRPGRHGERDNGNGSLMRVLPLALWHDGTDAELIDDAFRQSRVTHGHPRGQVCCALYCLWARRALEDVEDPWASAVAALRDHHGPGSPARDELETVDPSRRASRGSGGGYVLDCLHSARMVVAQAGSFEHVVKSAIALGHDTDTTAAVAGGIAGLRDGSRALPSRWVENLRGRDVYEPLLRRLVERRTE